MRGRVGALVLALMLSLGGLLTACGGESHDESLLGDGSAPASPRATRTTPVPTTVPQVLEALTAAVTRHDRARFSALLGGDPAFRRAQLRLYDNLQRLPVADLRLTLDEDGVVRRTLRLDGYDEGSLAGPAGIRVDTDRGRLAVLPDPDHTPQAPWDLTALHVSRSDSALVLTDRANAGRAGDVLAAAAGAVTADGRVLEASWPERVVVYVFTDPAVRATYAEVPGGTSEHLGALTFPAGSGDELVGSRVALLPAALDAGRDELDRLLRHEIVHVALGERDDGVPTWLSEGIADWVAAQPVPESRRRIPTVAVDRARAGYVDLPTSASFHGPDETFHYAVSWMACETIAAEAGPSALWRLLDAMRDAGVGRDGTGGIGQDAVLRQVTGLDELTLGDRTAARILAQFG